MTHNDTMTVIILDGLKIFAVTADEIGTTSKPDPDRQMWCEFICYLKHF
jgi:hypothetical protein